MPTLESTLQKQRTELYLNWGNTLSFAYLNNEHYIDQHLNNNIKNQINNYKTIMRINAR